MLHSFIYSYIWWMLLLNNLAGYLPNSLEIQICIPIFTFMSSGFGAYPDYQSWKPDWAKFSLHLWKTAVSRREFWFLKDQNTRDVHLTLGFQVRFPFVASECRLGVSLGSNVQTHSSSVEVIISFQACMCSLPQLPMKMYKSQCMVVLSDSPATTNSWQGAANSILFKPEKNKIIK